MKEINLNIATNNCIREHVGVGVGVNIELSPRVATGRLLRDHGIDWTDRNTEKL